MKKMKDSDSDEGKPHIEMEFDSDDARVLFYNGYAKSKGSETFEGQHINPSKSP